MALEALDNISDLTLPLFAFYLIIFCNFSKETIGCRLGYVLDTNMYAKHFITFLLLFFLVILVDPKSSSQDFLVNFGLSLLIYTIYIITTRTSFPIMMIIILLLLTSYILGSFAKKKKEENNEEEYKKLKLAQNIIFIILLVLAIIGFIIYGIEKYREYHKDFSLLKFIFGNPRCRRYTPTAAKII
jgi:hypothetical protein